MREASAGFDAVGWEVELIVCDNNSTDKTPGIARQAGAQVVFEPVNQIGRARNRGAQAATGEWLVFVDADSEPSRELFADVAREILSGRTLAGGSTVVLDAEHRAGAWVAGSWNWLSRFARLLAGSFIFCETAAFRQVGGFSTELFAAEELELTGKLKRLAKGRKQRIVILHRHPLVTSGRKIHLYSSLEHFRFVIKASLRPGQVLRNREACHTWYDGRR